MASLVVLDSGPLGLASKAPGKPDVDHCLAWIGMLRAGGHAVAIPEIARYEVRRELVRAGATAGMKRLDRLRDTLFYLYFSPAVMDLACSMWAHVRRAGVPTAPDDALDGDAILAAQAMDAANHWGEVIIATTNVGHLIRFPGIHAREWKSIT